MAYIPYGYRIERGKAVVDREAEEKIRQFVNCYLDGASMNTAAREAGLPVQGETIIRIMEKGTYLGDDYYPPILDVDTVNRAAAERQERYERLGCFQRKGPEKPEPVKTRFCVRMPQKPAEKGSVEDRNTPAEKIAFLYSCIRPDANGSTQITRADKEKLVNLAQNCDRHNGEETICQ